METESIEKECIDVLIFFFSSYRKTSWNTFPFAICQIGITKILFHLNFLLNHIMGLRLPLSIAMEFNNSDNMVCKSLTSSVATEG